MKKKWTWSQMLLAAAAVALLVSGSTFVAAKPGGGGGKPGGGGGEDPQLPPVRYRIQFIDLPANVTGTPTPYVNDINNLGQVVGNYAAEDGQRAFLFNGDQAIDLNEIVAAGLPDDGWRLRSALAINDHMVVVGNIEKIGSDPIETRPIAIDLAADNPVVDLLPDVGVVFGLTAGYRINENGDILGIYELANGIYGAWFYNPGLYDGDPAVREIKVDPFRFNQSLDLLPTDDQQQPYGMNSAGDLLTYSYVYRDDWGWVKIDDLVVGTDPDVQAWSSGTAYVAYQNGINDRGGPSDAGQITGYFSDGRLFVLTPEPAQAP